MRGKTDVVFRFHLATLRDILPGLLAALVALAGWFYLLNSNAARRLAAVEEPAINLRRIRLRRFGGFVMMLLAAGLFAGCYLVSQARKGAFLAVWLAVMLLLLIVVVLALEDVRLTARLRHKRKVGGKAKNDDT